ncbi:hypothetical protein VTN02DRAFT_6576 [Thermoascus thermophilus]
MSFKYRVYRLSHEADELSPETIGKFASLRLRALRDVPDRLDGYETHLTFGETEWLALLTNRIRHNFICVAYPMDTEATSLHSGTWVGMITLLGPLSDSIYSFTRNKDDLVSGPNTTSTLWHGMGLYLLPEHRGTEAVNAIRDTLLYFLRSYTEEYHEAGEVDSMCKRFQLRGFVKPGMEMLTNFYKSSGAREVAHIPREEAHRLNEKMGLVELVSHEAEDEFVEEDDEEPYVVVEMRGEC